MAHENVRVESTAADTVTATGCPPGRFGDLGAGGRVVNNSNLIDPIRAFSWGARMGSTGRTAAGRCRPGAPAGAETNWR
jgi:hypothetical protein